MQMNEKTTSANRIPSTVSIESKTKIFDAAKTQLSAADMTMFKDHHERVRKGGLFMKDNKGVDDCGLTWCITKMAGVLQSYKMIEIDDDGQSIEKVVDFPTLVKDWKSPAFFEYFTRGCCGNTCS